MRFIFYTNRNSPHQLPLAKRLVRYFGESNYRYLYYKSIPESRKKLGWSEERESWIEHVDKNVSDVSDKLLACDVLMCSERCVGVFEQRCREHKPTLYTSERWFKPIVVSVFGVMFSFSGILRILDVRRWRMYARMIKLLRNDGFVYLPTGVWAARDMFRLVAIFSGRFAYFFKTPEISYDPWPGAVVHSKSVPGLESIRMWGYFIESGDRNPMCQAKNKLDDRIGKIIWIGRFVDWKRPKDIIRAVSLINGRVEGPSKKIMLDMYGDGPEKAKLKHLVEANSNIRILNPIQMAEVRHVMRNYDAIVMTSNAYEGWGAVVSEALAEGLKVIGTDAAGSSATLLPISCIYHVGDIEQLSGLLTENVSSIGLRQWNADAAADALIRICSAALGRVQV